MKPKPSIGQMVHYVSHGTPPRGDGTQAYTSECRAAFVTELTSDPTYPGQVGLCVLNPTGQFFSRGVPYSDGHEKPGEPAGGTWHWADHAD